MVTEPANAAPFSDESKVRSPVAVNPCTGTTYWRKLIVCDAPAVVPHPRPAKLMAGEIFCAPTVAGVTLFRSTDTVGVFPIAAVVVRLPAVQTPVVIVPTLANEDRVVTALLTKVPEVGSVTDVVAVVVRVVANAPEVVNAPPNVIWLAPILNVPEATNGLVNVAILFVTSNRLVVPSFA